MATETHIKVGEKVEFSRRISAEDIRRFAEVSGDFAPIHVDEAFARKTRYGRPIAHGALLMGLLSSASSVISARSVERGATATSVSLGYDRIRIIKPVFADDTVTARYTVESVDDEVGRTVSRIEIVNQNNELCLVGSHVLKWVKDG